MQKLHEFRFKGAMLPSDLINPIKPLEVASWLKAHPGSFPAFAVALLPDADSQSRHLSKCYQQSLAWVRWAMLGAPESVHQALSSLLDMEGQATGACGSQWGSDDIAYRYCFIHFICTSFSVDSVSNDFLSTCFCICSLGYPVFLLPLWGSGQIAVSLRSPS
jgi:hypothetical protein